MAPESKNVRTGLGPVRTRITVRADDPSPEACKAVDVILAAATPRARLARCRERAVGYPDAREDWLDFEMDVVDGLLIAGNGSLEVVGELALTGIERGLDLLHAGRFVPVVQKGLAIPLNAKKAAAAPRPKARSTGRKLVVELFKNYITHNQESGLKEALLDLKREHLCRECQVEYAASEDTYHFSRYGEERPFCLYKFSSLHGLWAEAKKGL